MGTISSTIKPSKNILSYNTLDDTFISKYDEALTKINKGDYIYVEIGNSMSSVVKVNKVVNYINGLALEYEYMVNRFNKLYKEKWCYVDYCRFATTEEIKLLNKKIKYNKNVKEI